MPAVQDIRTLLKFRTVVEPAMVSALTSTDLPGLPPANVYASHSSEVRATPCLSVTLQMGEANGHKFNPPTLTYWVFDQWRAQLNLELRTARGVNADMHEEFEATIRLCLLDIFTRVNANMPYHAFAEPFREVNAVRTMHEASKQDITSFTFGSVLAIRRDAWPTT